MTDGLKCVKDERQRAMLREFCRRFDDAVVDCGSLTAFWLLNEEYAQNPEMYPQYVLVADGRIDETELDLLFFRMQDEYGWPPGHYFANSYSAKNVFSLPDLHEGLRAENVYLDSSDIKKLLRGEYLSLAERTDAESQSFLRSTFSQLGEDIDGWSDALGVDTLCEDIERYRSLPRDRRHPGIGTAIGNSFYRKRGKAPTRPTPVLQCIGASLDNYQYAGRPERHFLYGRTNGIGKSQYLYHLMGYLHRIGLPFVYKEPFYFHYRRHRAGGDEQTEQTLFDVVGGDGEDPELMTRWLRTLGEEMAGQTGVRPILLVDEEELCWPLLQDYFIVAADKNLPPYNNGRWRIYEMLLDDPVDEEYVARALRDELSALGVDSEQFPHKYAWTNLVAQHSHVPHFHYVRRPSVYHGKRLLSLSLLGAVRRHLHEGGPLHLRMTDVAAWAPHYWSKFVPRAVGETDFHCEYIIYNGTEYMYDPYAPYDPGEIISACAAASTPSF